MREIVHRGLSLVSATRLAGSLAVLAALTAMPVSSYSQTPANDLAAQVREQGHRCEEPVSAVRDVRLSRPDSAVWILTCRNAAYRVRLDPDMGARIVRLKKHS